MSLDTPIQGKFELRSLLTAVIQSVIEDQRVIKIFLVNGIKLEGKVIGYDDQVILLKSTYHENHSQLIYQGAIATVLTA